jgi:hypothetical protein
MGFCTPRRPNGLVHQTAIPPTSPARRPIRQTPQDIVASLNDAHRGFWRIQYSPLRRDFIAYPVWPGTSGRTVLGHDSTELLRQMNEAEETAGVL